MENINNKIIHGDALTVLKQLPDESINCVVTSPPYWGLRDYGVSGQLGLEKSFDEYINNLCDIFDEVKRVLKKDGTCWVNIGDSYAGSGKGPERGISKGNEYRHLEHKTERFKSNAAQAKSLCQIPSRFAIEMCNRGWILRNEIIWHKPNCMPSSVTDRFTVDFEKVFFFTKNQKYFFTQQKEKAKWADDPRAGRGRIHYENGKRDGKKGQGQENFVSITQERNVRAVWSIPLKGFKQAHFATYPEKLIYPMISAGCPRGGVVLDPFFGAGTTAVVALKQDKKYIGIELNEEYIKIAEDRLNLKQQKLLCTQ